MAAGDRNSIQKLQAGLRLLGYDAGKVDGAVGKNTNDQIAKFLKDSNLTDINSADIGLVLEKVRQKVLSDPGANERLMKMAQNPASLDPDNLKILQGGLALHNVRTGPGVDRIVIDGKMGAQTTEAVAKFSAAAPMNSTQVKLLQGGLALLGYDAGRIDGKLGRNTHAALDDFAAKNNLKNTNPEDLLKAVQDAVKNSGDARELMHAIGNSDKANAHNVMMLQAGLSLMGQTTLIDGSKGPETKGNFAIWSGANPVSIMPQFNTNGRDIKEQKPETAFAPPAAANPTIKDDLSLRVRRAVVLESMPKAATAAGVPEKFMQGLWGRESGFGKNLVSITNCQGDWQFSRDTFARTIERHGAAIAHQIELDGFDEKANLLRKAAFERGSFSPSSDFQNLRNDPLISTYAAAYHIKDLARELGIKNINDSKEWGKLYAGFNVGSSRASALDGEMRDTPDVIGIIGRDAELNSSFFGGHATGEKVLENYAREINKFIITFEREFGTSSPALAVATVKPASYASSGEKGNTGKMTIQNDFRTVAWGILSDDSNPQKARLSLIKDAGQELTRPVERQRPAFSPQPTLTI